MNNVVRLDKHPDAPSATERAPRAAARFAAAAGAILSHTASRVLLGALVLVFTVLARVAHILTVFSTFALICLTVAELVRDWKDMHLFSQVGLLTLGLFVGSIVLQVILQTIREAQSKRLN